MITIQEKRQGTCDLDHKEKDEVYGFTVQGETGEYVCCWACMKKLVDLKLLRSGKAKSKPPAGTLPNMS